jgi:KDO2-lipid IV(A) lauroyltransferase
MVNHPLPLVEAHHGAMTMPAERPATTASEPIGASLRHDGLFWRRLAYLGSAYGPEWWKRSSPPFIAAAIFALVRANREGAISNLRQVLGPRPRLQELRSGLRLFSEFAHCVCETLELHSPRARELTLEVGEPEELAAVLASRRGVIVLTSHFGNWEVGARVMQRFGRPVNVVMARESNPTVEAFQLRTRERMQLKVLHSDSSPFAAFDMVRALRRGEVVAMQIDRSAPGQVTRRVPFFGRPAPFQYGPFVLARLAGAPIVPVLAIRTGVRSYRILPEPLRWIDRDATEEETLEVMTEVVCGFERRIREHPHQWFQFRPFWEEPPDSRMRQR